MSSSLYPLIAFTNPQTGVLEGHTHTVKSVAFLPYGTRIVSGSWDGTTKIWDVSIGQTTVEPMMVLRSQVLCVAASPDGGKVVSGYSDGILCIWDAETGELLASQEAAHQDSVPLVEAIRPQK